MIRRPPLLASTAPLALLAAWLGGGAAHAQAPRPVERNLPPVVQAPSTAPVAPPAQPGVQDAQPLGGVLRTVRLYGPAEALLAEGAPLPVGVVVGDLDPGARLNFRQVLGVYVGQPLSRKLIRDVQIAATRLYRRAGYPFVSVVAPPQELTGGVLQLRVTEFRSGGVTVNGGGPADQARVLAQAPLPPGSRLQSSAVDEDFDWMARYPYRRVQGVFSPGDEVGESRLTLNVNDTKPWQVFAGASNTGARATGLARYFVGFGAGFPQAGDLTVSYQFTGGTDFWDDPGRYDDGARRPSYISQSGRLALPVGVHQEVEATPSYVVQSERVGQQTFATDIFELPLTYTTAVSNILPGVHLGQLSVGVNVTTESRRTYFNGLSVATGEADLFEVSGGWSNTFRDPFGSTSVGLRAVVNPGGVLGLNADHVWDWMDALPETFAYRCLPLNIANAHGWEMLSPCGFEACWNGGGAPGDVILRLDGGADPQTAPVALFGQGVLTFHIYGLFRTEPGWNLWIGGSPNRPKDGIYPLTGVMETDWAPFTFTMNWRFTRPDTWVRVDKGEPICFVFPVQRGYLEATTPKLVALDADPDLRDRFRAWSRSRNDFGTKVRAETPARPSARWQKHYFRGVDVDGAPGAEDHCTKLRLPPFLPASEAPQMPAVEPAITPSRPPGAEQERPRPDPPPVIIKRGDADALAASTLAPRKREWLLETIEAHRCLSPAGHAIERRADLSREAFFEDYYVRHRPVVLAGEMADWPALWKWTASYLRTQVGSRVVEYQGDRDGASNYEPNKVAHRRRATFDAFMDKVECSQTGNDAYLTAFNSKTNAEVFTPLMADVGRLDKVLAYDRAPNPGMPWIGAAGSFTPLHHDLTNNLIAQVAGRKQFKIVSASSAGRLRNREHVFSDIADLDRPAFDPQARAALDELVIHTVTLSPGEIIFMPIGWWHQVRAIDFSISLTFTNFHWKNDFHTNYPRS